MVSVLKSIFYDSIQDLGRIGFQEYGVPVSGVMDMYAAKVANALLGNAENCAVMEITMSGPVLQFGCDTNICISGADMSPKLNDLPFETNKAIRVSKGDVVSFGRLKFGFRCYLAVSGGFGTETALGSRSMFKGVTKQFKIAKNDVLSISEEPFILKAKNASLKINQDHFDSKHISVFEGPEFNQLSKSQQALLFSRPFTISKDNSRMAYQLEESLENSLESIITSAVLPGTVQLTPSGKLIILMRDCQITGGYPRVLQLKASSISVLAQKFTGHIVKLKLLEY
tara:strand:- start:31012 stop:31863 length:852 start_codon:yes stop_codon:yes gene_type:complete